MNILKKFTVVLAAMLLPGVLLGFGLSWSIHQVFGTPNHLESALQQSGIYNTAVGDALSAAQQKQSSQPGANNGGGENNIPLDQPAIKQVIEQSISPQYLQTQVNGVINSVYAWAHGQQSTLSFNIDLGPAKQKLADNLASYTTQKLASLPVCTGAQQLQSGSDVDPFNATCVPKGFDAAGAGNKIRDNILNGDFLKNTQISADSIKGKNGKTLGQQLQPVPNIYHKVKLGIIGLGLMALLLSAAVIFCSVDIRHGLRKIAGIYAPVGIIVILLTFALNFGLNKASQTLAQQASSTKAIQQSVLRAVQILAGDLRLYWLLFGGALLVITVACIVAQFVMKSKAAAMPAPETPAMANNPPAPGVPTKAPSPTISDVKPPTPKKLKKDSKAKI